MTGLLTEDTLSVRDEGNAAGEIGVDGTNVSYSGTTIGTVSGGAGTDLTISLHANATSAAMDALIQNLTYANSSDTPTANLELFFSVTDALSLGLGSNTFRP